MPFQRPSGLGSAISAWECNGGILKIRLITSQAVCAVYYCHVYFINLFFVNFVHLLTKKFFFVQSNQRLS